jgi:hypothetical protein
MIQIIDPFKNNGFWAKNPILIGVQTDAYLANYNQMYASFTIDFSSGIQSWSILEFAWGAKKVTFYARWTWQNTGFEIPSFGTPTQAIMDNLASIIGGMTDVKDDWLVLAVNSTQLSFSAKKIGSAYSLVSFTVTNNGPNQVTTAANFLGVDIAYNKNFSIRCRINLATSNQKRTNSSIEYKQVATLVGIPQEDAAFPFPNHSCYFDVAEIISALLSAPTPYHGFSGEYVIANTQMREFRLDFCEQFGEPKINYATVSYINAAILGGLAEKELVQAIPNRYHFHNNHSTSNRFMTWQPREKLVSKTSKEVLHFYLFQASSVRKKTKIFYENGTSLVINSGGMGVDTTKHNIIAVAAGYAEEGIGFWQPAYNVTHWEVYLEDMATFQPLSETFKFVLDKNCGYERNFLFLNALGGWDTIRTLGDSQTSFSISSVENDKPLVYVPATGVITYQNSKAVVSKELKKKIKVTSGLLNKTTMKYLHDFLASECVFEDINGGYQPIRITSSNISTVQESDDLNTFAFDYEYLTDENIFSEDSIPGYLY